MSLVRCLMLACLLAPAVNAFAASPAGLDMAMKLITVSQTPRLVEDALVLTFKPERPTRIVGVRFAHESWTVLHLYTVNENGVFVLDYPVPEGVREIRYRVMVDGLWMADPTNPRVETDALGQEFSVFTLAREPVRPLITPQWERDGTVTFIFRGTPGKRVAIVGDFNNWDPLMDFLSEDAPGTYSINLRMLPGRHWYYFATEGRRVLDMFNAASGFDPEGAPVSTFILPS